MFGEIGAWFYKGLAGIYPDSEQPGFKHIKLRPYFPDGLDEFTARHTSPYGEIVSGWSTKGGKLIYQVTIPANSSATLTLPEGWTCNEGEKHELQAGRYTFTCKKKK